MKTVRILLSVDHDDSSALTLRVESETDEMITGIDQHGIKHIFDRRAARSIEPVAKRAKATQLEF